VAGRPTVEGPFTVAIPVSPLGVTIDAACDVNLLLFYQRDHTLADFNNAGLSRAAHCYYVLRGQFGSGRAGLGRHCLILR